MRELRGSSTYSSFSERRHRQRVGARRRSATAARGAGGHSRRSLLSEASAAASAVEPAPELRLMTDWARAADRLTLPVATIGGADGAHFLDRRATQRQAFGDAIPAVACAAARPLPTRDAQRCDGTGRPARATTAADVVLATASTGASTTSPARSRRSTSAASPTRPSPSRRPPPTSCSRRARCAPPPSTAPPTRRRARARPTSSRRSRRRAHHPTATSPTPRRRAEASGSRRTRRFEEEAAAEAAGAAKATTKADVRPDPVGGVTANLTVAGGGMRTPRGCGRRRGAGGTSGTATRSRR